MFLKYLDLQLMRYCVSTGNDKFLSDLCNQQNMVMTSSSSEGSSSFSQTSSSDMVIIEQLKNVSCPVAKIDATKKPFHVLIPPCKERCFDDSEIVVLEQMYSLLYPTSTVNYTRFYHQYKKILINDEEFL